MSALNTLMDDLLLHVASYLPAKDLIHFECISSTFSNLDIGKIWKRLCEIRWKPWPRYRLTPSRNDIISRNFANCGWKDHYLRVELEATSMEIKTSDLQNLSWFLSFTMTGVRGETASDLQQVHFRGSVLLVPGYPPLPYEIVDETPPTIPSPRNCKIGDQLFSTKQWLRIANFPPHFITKRISNAEWFIANKNVKLVSSEKSWITKELFN